MTATTNLTGQPHVVAELDNRAIIVWTTDAELGPRGYGTVRAGGFLPRRTYPIAVMDAVGNITRITRDPLPPQEKLAAYLADLQKPQLASLAEAVDAGPGDLVAIDSSGSTETEFIARWGAHFAERGAEVVLFDHEVHRYTDGLRGGGMCDPRPLISYVQDRLLHPRRVFVLTDGLMSPADPAVPSRWTWVLPADGEDWMTDRNAGRVVYAA